MMKIPHPIPYQGSKRNLAPCILPFFPHNIRRLIEPFAGSAAITLAAAEKQLADSYVINDALPPALPLGASFGDGRVLAGAWNYAQLAPPRWRGTGRAASY
ncbi:MAG: hypothetical protein C0502_06970 [Opitutus sp.]|nr:hypothetical protein [Opitutus sp.]